MTSGFRLRASSPNSEPRILYPEMADAALLRELVTIQRRTTGTPGGTIRDAWVEDFRTRANVHAASSRESEQLGYIGDQMLYIVRMHFRTDMTGDMRIVWNSPTGPRTLNIYGVPYDPDGLRTDLVMGCTEEVEE